jgi:hypothetical protein
VIVKSKAEIDRLARDLCDDDRAVEAAWIMLTASNPPPPAVSARDIEALKTCYFLGADFVMQILVTAARDDWSEQDIDRQMAKVMIELRNFLHARAAEAVQKLDANLH